MCDIRVEVQTTACGEQKCVRIKTQVWNVSCPSLLPRTEHILRNRSPKNEKMLKTYSPSDHRRCK